MKKLMSVLLGLSLMLGIASVSFAQETKTEDKKESKKKKGGKKKAAERRRPTRRSSFSQSSSFIAALSPRLRVRRAAKAF